jgi:CIC family chloride channel protein
MARAAPQQLRLREHQLFLVLSIVVGVVAGLSAVLFALAIDRTSRTLFGIAPSGVRLFIVPAGVSLLTGVLLKRFFADARGSGVPQTKAAFHLAGGIIRPRVPIGKFVTGVLCIGSGHSMGREGPSVQIGAGIASAIGQWVRLPAPRIKELIPVGVAGALSAAFNTPVAAVVFALEEIIGDLNARLLGSTVVASVASVVAARSILGNEPLFRVPAYTFVHPMELVGYALLGIAGGFLSLLFCRTLLGLRRMFLRLPARTRVFQPAMGGVAIGLVLLVVPQVMGVGYQYVDQALNGGLVLKTLVLLCLVKAAATIVSYASGNAGGIFAPTLFIGAMAGGALGAMMNQYSPFPTGDPGAYALVGMGTLFAGIIRAPMTSVFMIFELTQDYQIIVPLMVANLLSFAISRHYQAVPIYHALLQQDGVHLPSASAVAEASEWTANDIMSREVEWLSPDMRVDAVDAIGRASARRAFLVGSPKRLIGVVTSDRAAAATEAGRGGEAVAVLAERMPAHTHGDHTVDVVLDRFERSPGLLPVLAREASDHVEGIITVREIAAWLRGDRNRRH